MDYTIKQGDNLSTIAQNNNTDVATLSKLNNIQNPNLIQSGGILKLPSPLTTTMPSTTNVNAQTLGATQPITLPATPTPTIPAPASTFAENYLNSLTLTQRENDLQSKKDTGLDKYFNNLIAQEGSSQYEQDLLKASTIAADKTALQEIINKKSKLQAEVSQDDISLVANSRALERRDTLLPFAQIGQAKLAGDAAITRGLKNAEIMMLDVASIAKQGNIQLSRDLIKDAMDAKYKPMKDENERIESLLTAIDKALTPAEKKIAAAQAFKLNKANKEIDALSEFQTKALTAAYSNDAPQSIIDIIAKAQSIGDIAKVGSQWIVSKADKLDQAYKQSQTAKNYFDIGNVGNINQLSNEQVNQLASSDPVGYFSQIIKQNKIKGSTTLESLLGVIGAAKDLADFGIEKEGFKGASPIRLTPGFLKGEKQLTTQASLDAINLKVQQWASGASLTEAQTKQVKRFTPDINDTDEQIKTKLNNLTNFMIEQGTASLANQGVSIKFPKIDLFNKNNSTQTSQNIISNDEFLDLPTASSTLSNSQFFSN